MTAKSGKPTRWLLIVVVVLVFALLLFAESAIFQTIAFGSPSRPTWSTLLLMGIIVGVPLVAGIALLLRAAFFTLENEFRRAFWNLIGAVVVPILGFVLGSQLLIQRLIP